MKPEESAEILRSAARGQLDPDAAAQRLKALRSRDPKEAAEWEEELRLSALLAGLGDAPLRPDFTARVMAAARNRRPARAAAAPILRFPALSPSVLRRVAAAAAVALLLVAGIHWRRHAERERLARSIEAVAPLIAAAPDIDLLQDFEAIYALPEGPLPDLEPLTEARQ